MRQWELGPLAPGMWTGRILCAPSASVAEQDWGAWSVSVSVRTTPCTATSCDSRGGQCQVGWASPALLLAQCRCGARYAGEACEVQVVSTAFYTLQVVLLVGSNLAMVPAVVLAVRKRMIGERKAVRIVAARVVAFSQSERCPAAESIVLVCSFVVSAVYHMCDTGTMCFDLHYSMLQSLDFLLALLSIGMMALHFTALSRLTRVRARSPRHHAR